MSTVYSIGPGEIAKAGTPGGPSFILSKTEWITVQAYIINALALPTTDTEFRHSLGSGAPPDLSDFTRLVACYVSMNKNCKGWQKDTYPRTVALAGDIYHYGKNLAPVYYGALLPLADALAANPDNQKTKDKLKAVLGVLKKEAEDFSARADAVAKEIQTFANQTSADKSTLVGPQGNAGLVKYYTDKYGRASTEVETLLGLIDDQRKILNAANADYNHAVVVASTTPAYAWVFPAGTIAAASVATIYGIKARDAADRASAAQAKIDELEDKLTAACNVVTGIKLAEVGMSQILTALTSALPVIQKIQGVWGKLAEDLGNISNLVDKQVAGVPPLIMDLGVDAAKAAWSNVADAADRYRINAYVQQGGGGGSSRMISMEEWRLNNLVAPAAA
jgi:hypothetical protein